MQKLTAMATVSTDGEELSDGTNPNKTDSDADGFTGEETIAHTTDEPR